MLWLHSATVALQSRLSTRQHAIELRDRGYTVIPDAGINPSLIADARAACLAEHQWLLEGVAELGIDAVADKYAFAEIDKRHRLRWALKPSRGPSAWTRAVDEAVQVAADVIEEVHRQPAHPDDSDAVWTRHLPLPTRAEVLDTGAILSAPGAAAQTFHADSGKLHHRLARLSPRHRLYSLFVPLVDLDEGGDGTMLWPGSHLEQTRYDRCAPPRPPSVAHAASLGFPEGTRKAHALRHTSEGASPHGRHACMPSVRRHACPCAGTRRRWRVLGRASGWRTTRWPWGRWSCLHARQAACCFGTSARSTAACPMTRSEVLCIYMAPATSLEPSSRAAARSEPRPPSSSAARPIAHAVLSTGLARDRLDVAQASLTAELAALPAEGAARDAARASIARLQAERWQKVRTSSAS